MLTRRAFTGTALCAGLTATAAATQARAETAAIINTRVNLALEQMWSQVPQSRQIATRARAALVMPDVVKAGLILGGSYGEGALLMNDAAQGYQAPATGYYSVAAASIGFQAGVQTTNHVLFFMTDEAVTGFRRADGWEVGADAEVTFPEAGLNLSVDSALFEKPVIGYVFGQDGFLVGASLEGAKYSPIVR
ncbi:MAG: YSC84-related protein [Pseudomonadota bacterium]